jgi:hypothetical protein
MGAIVIAREIGLRRARSFGTLAFMRTVLLCLFLALLAAPALADGEIDRLITPADDAKLDGFDKIFAEALAEARKGGSREDLAVLDAALEGQPLDIASYRLAGDWRCRTIKLGGMLPLTVYPWFACRISETGIGEVLEKRTGSQRTKGRFFIMGETRLAYLGAGFVAGEKPRRYNEDPKENQVAYVERRAKNRLIMMFPAPQYESKFDILVLEK